MCVSSKFSRKNNFWDPKVKNSCKSDRMTTNQMGHILCTHFICKNGRKSPAHTYFPAKNGVFFMNI